MADIDFQRRNVFHEEKLITVRKARKELTQKERELLRKVPLELLAKEWLNDQKTSTEMRCYLVEKLLPILVVSLEKLLTEVSLRDLADSRDEQSNFNPINFIGQYLMRNNPKYSNPSEAHPYCRTMKQVNEELVKIAYLIDSNKLAELKVETKTRRMVREEQEACQREEKQRNTELLKKVYAKWLVPRENGLPMTDVKLAVESWIEVMPESLTEAHSLSLSMLFSEDPLMWEESEFVSAFLEHGCEVLETDTFYQLVNQLEMCGTERRRNELREERKNLFISVFESCDPDKTNAVDRLRVLHLLACYYDSLSVEKQETLCNPRQWPIMDVVEVEELEEDEECQPLSLSKHHLLEFFEGSMDSVEVCDVVLPEEEGNEEGGKSVTGDKEGDDGDEEIEVKDSEEKLEVKGVAGEEEVESERVKEEVESERVKEEVESPKEENVESVKSEEVSTEDEDVASSKEENAESAKHEETEVEGAKNEEEDEKEKEEGKNEEPEFEFKPSGVPVGNHVSSAGFLERRLTAGSRSRVKSLLRMRNICGMPSQPIPPSGPGAVWNHEQLNVSQFVQLVELFAGAEPEQALVNSISLYIKNNYIETEKERSEHIEQKQQQANVLFKRKLVNKLFEIWDNDRSGYLELNELQIILSKWKDFDTEKGKEKVEAILLSLGDNQKHLTRLKFYTFIEELTSGMESSDFNAFMEFLVTSVKLTFEEQRRGEERKLLLAQIMKAGKMNALDFVPAMKTAVRVIHQDVEEFGDKKDITVLISLCEPSGSNSTSLCIKAASQGIEHKVIGSKIHHCNTEGIGFIAMDSARLVHVEKIQNDGRAYFFLPEHRGPEYDGSLVVAPIITPKQDVVGTISVDSLKKGSFKNHCFHNHEMNFFQGVGLCLGEIHRWISVMQKLLKVSLSALNWIHSQCSAVAMGEVYVVQPTDEENSSYNLCLMLSTSKSQSPILNINKKIKRRGNLFKEYLFQCVENSEPMSVDAYSSHHLVYPIRDSSGCAVAIVDLTMTSLHSPLNPQQLREVTKVLKLLTTAFYQISSTLTQKQEQEHGQEEEEKEKEEVEEEKRKEGDEKDEDNLSDYNISDDTDMSALFDQLMLADLRDKLMSVDSKLFAELRSYMDPPQTILKIIRALLYILYPDQEFNTWAQCKQRVTISLVKALQSYDPLQVKSHSKLSLIKELTGLPVSDDDTDDQSVCEYGSLPAKYIYRWVYVCVTLLEHSTNPPITSTLPTTSTNSDP